MNRVTAIKICASEESGIARRMNQLSIYEPLEMMSERLVVDVAGVDDSCNHIIGVNNAGLKRESVDDGGRVDDARLGLDSVSICQTVKRLGGTTNHCSDGEGTLKA